ncbi:hypothetical protein [Aliikangiella sp. IMCC44359]|uniref:hypothetical protein n=1 Tax=Aliikangiella sp. IMCC44359 TaxID=3459125 RepID=UPI00403A9369
MNLHQVNFFVNNMSAATRYYQEMGFIAISQSPQLSCFELPEGSNYFCLLLKNKVEAEQR